MIFKSAALNCELRLCDDLRTIASDYNWLRMVAISPNVMYQIVSAYVPWSTKMMHVGELEMKERAPHMRQVT